MQFKHTPARISASFDDPNLVSAAGVAPVMRPAECAGLSRLADHHLKVPGDKGANAGGKLFSLIAGMVCGADSIDDMSVHAEALGPRVRPINTRIVPAGVHVRACAAG